MASVQHTEQQQQRIDLGGRLFLLGVFAILVVELAGTWVNIGSSFEWTSLLLNVFSAVFILYLGNWLYNGDKTALSVARYWVAFMVVVVGIGLVCSWLELTHPDVGRYLGITAVWLGLLKFFPYLLFAAALWCPGYVLDFLTAKRGETLEASTTVTAEQPATSGTPAELTAEHATGLDGLAGAMQNASYVLLAVGLIEIVCNLGRVGSDNALPAILNIVEGLALATLGCLLVAPAKAVQAVVAAAQRHMGLVMQILERFHALYLAYLATFGVLAVVWLCRVLFGTL
jgi:hypothetical protein